MLEVLQYIALNALNTVQKIKAMSKMSKIDKVYIRGVMLCMSKMSEMLKIYKHIFAHTFLNIQRIFNLEKVLKSWDIGLSNHTIKYCVY